MNWITLAHSYGLIIQQSTSYAQVKRIPFLSWSRKGTLWPTWYLYIYSYLDIYMVIIVPVVIVVPSMVTVVPLSALKSRLHVILIKLECFCLHFTDWKVKNDKPVFLRCSSPCPQAPARSTCQVLICSFGSLLMLQDKQVETSFYFT